MKLLLLLIFLYAGNLTAQIHLFNAKPDKLHQWYEPLNSDSLKNDSLNIISNAILDGKANKAFGLIKFLKDGQHSLTKQQVKQIAKEALYSSVVVENENFYKPLLAFQPDFLTSKSEDCICSSYFLAIFIGASDALHYFNEALKQQDKFNFNEIFRAAVNTNNEYLLKYAYAKMTGNAEALSLVNASWKFGLLEENFAEMQKVKYDWGNNISVLIEQGEAELQAIFFGLPGVEQISEVDNLEPE